MSTVKWDIKVIMSQHSKYVDQLLMVQSFSLNYLLIDSSVLLGI